MIIQYVLLDKIFTHLTAAPKWGLDLDCPLKGKQWSTESLPRIKFHPRGFLELAMAK